MSTWMLHELFHHLNDDISGQLFVARQSFEHNTTKGDATEDIWRAFLAKYLPRRYVVSRALIVDSYGTFSDQIDIVIYDRQYNPFVLQHGGQSIVPSESVYAVFEVKQEINGAEIKYAEAKVKSVRRLKRRFRRLNPNRHPVPMAKTPQGWRRPPILGGLLATGSGWKYTAQGLGGKAPASRSATNALDLGCIAREGIFDRLAQNRYRFTRSDAPVVEFIFRLIHELQNRGTVSMINFSAYAKVMHQ